MPIQAEALHDAVIRALYRDGQLPRCAACRKPVDYVDTDWEPHGNRVRVTAGCHGAEEQVVVDLSKIVDADEIRSGDVFQHATRSRQIPAAPDTDRACGGNASARQSTT